MIYLCSPSESKILPSFIQKLTFINFKINNPLENPKAIKLLNKIQRDLQRNGIIINTLVEDLKELRPFAVEEKKPLLAKVIRLTYEHIAAYQTFDKVGS